MARRRGSPSRLLPRMRKRADLLLVGAAFLKPRPRPGGDRRGAGQRGRRAGAQSSETIALTRRSPRRAASLGLARRPEARRGARRFRLDPRPRLPRRRRLDRRLHRRAAARGARSVVRSTSATASSTRASPPTRGSRARRARRAQADRRSPARPRRSSATSASSRSGWCCRLFCRSPRGRPGSSAWSSRSSRSGATTSSRARSRTPPPPAACDAVRACVEGLGWTSLGLIPSPIAGGDGAREFLYAARHG